MKRAIAVVLCIISCFLLCPAVYAADLTISIQNTVVEYRPEGHYPTATASAYGYALRYEVTDSDSGERVTLPITEIGNYTVRAYIEASGNRPGASAAATFSVIPATAYISVSESVVAHTAMANPVSYEISPAFAAEHLDISVEYRQISSLSDEGKAVEVPVDMGTYMVHFTATSRDGRVSCPGKYLLYRIEESKGETLSHTEAIRTVPREFTAHVADVNAVYNGESVVPDYSFNVPLAESRLMYSYVHADGKIGAYTSVPPVEPGDYVAALFVLDTVVGSGRIVIAKKSLDIYMADCSFPYTEEGVYPPKATVNPEGVELVYTAYRTRGGVAGEIVEFPLTECGTYLISARPASIAHYGYTVSYCLLTVEKAAPVISGEDAVYVEDGGFKSVPVSVTPAFAEYDVSYYKLEGGVSTPIAGAPSKAGEYYAAVYVRENDRCKSATAVYGIYIKSSVDYNAVYAARVLKLLCLSVCLVAVVMGALHIYFAKRFGRR